MDSALFRLASQVALSTWAIAQISLLILSRGQPAPVTGVRWAVFGLTCFAGWMSLLSISISAAPIVPRANIVVILAVLEMGTALGAWGWLITNARARFKIDINRTHDRAIRE